MPTAVHATEQLWKNIHAGWVHDGVAWRGIYGMWAWDEAMGWRAEESTIAPVTCSIAPVNHLTAQVTWSIVGAASVAVYVNGVLRHQQNYPGAIPGVGAPSAGTLTVGGLTPGSQPTAYVRALFGSTWTQQAAAVKTTLPGMPAPSTVAISGVTSSSMTISWSAVSGATSYEVFNTANQHLHTTTALSWNRTGLTGATAYSYYVRARFNASVVSAPSAIKSATTTASFIAGTWVFKAADCNTWQATAKAWRGDPDGQTWHGNGQKWAGTSRGTQSAYFFGYKATNGQTIPQFFAGKQTRVTKVEVWVKRMDTAHGIWSAQECRFYKHNHTSKPSGAPSTTGSSHNNGKLARGENKWITLPVSWGEALIAGTIKGIVWGGVGPYSDGARYMIGHDLDRSTTMMQIRITTA